MLEPYGLHNIPDWQANVIRSFAIKWNCNEAFALTHAYFESGFNPWAIGDTYPNSQIIVYGVPYNLPYFPHLGTYARSYGMFQVNMAGGLGADRYPRWWEILNVMENCDIAIRSLAWWWSIGTNEGRREYDLFWYASVNAGFPGLVDYYDPNMQARYNYFMQLYQKPGGGWAEWPPLDSPYNPAPTKPNWVCDVTPSVPDNLYGWCAPLQMFQLWLNPVPIEGGAILPFTGMREYPAGEVVSIRAVPNIGWEFSHWSGDTSGFDNPISVIMNRNIGINAHFVELPPDPIEYALGITVTPEGSGVTTPPIGLYEYAPGTLVGVSVVPTEGYEFVRWEGSISSTLNPVTITMDENKWINAVMKEEIEPPPPPPPDTYTLAIGALPIEGGSTVPPPGIHTFAAGEDVTCNATPNEGYHFLYWEGATHTPSNIIVVRMDDNKSLTARFAETPEPGPIPPKPEDIPEIPDTLQGIKNTLRGIQQPVKPS